MQCHLDITSNIFALGADDFLAMMEGKIRVTPRFKITVWLESPWFKCDNEETIIYYKIWKLAPKNPNHVPKTKMGEIKTIWSWKRECYTISIKIQIVEIFH